MFLVSNMEILQSYRASAPSNDGKETSLRLH